MPADLHVSIDGNPELQAMLKATGRLLTEAIASAVAEAALNVESNAKRSTPVDTGRLRSSIGTKFLGVQQLEADVGTVVEYAEHVEFGTSHMPARPFLTPAREAAAGDFPNVVAKHARRVTG